MFAPTKEPGLGFVHRAWSREHDSSPRLSIMHPRICTKIKSRGTFSGTTDKELHGGYVQARPRDAGTPSAGPCSEHGSPEALLPPTRAPAPRRPLGRRCRCCRPRNEVGSCAARSGRGVRAAGFLGHTMMKRPSGRVTDIGGTIWSVSVAHCFVEMKLLEHYFT